MAGTARGVPGSAGDPPGARAKRGAAGTRDNRAVDCGSGGDPHFVHGPPGPGGFGWAL